MAETDYDGLKGVYRIAQGYEALDPDTAEIVTCDVLLQRELMHALRTQLPRGDLLPDLPFDHALNVLRSSWTKDVELIDQLYPVLEAFRKLRNAVAHPKDAAGMAALKAKVRAGYLTIDPGAAPDAAFAEIAQGLCLRLGGGMPLTEMVGIMDAMAGLIERWPSFGRSDE